MFLIGFISGIILVGLIVMIELVLLHRFGGFFIDKTISRVDKAAADKLEQKAILYPENDLKVKIDNQINDLPIDKLL